MLKKKVTRIFVRVIFCLGFFVVISSDVKAFGTFNVADGDVSGLIKAINAANTSLGPDTINLAHNGSYILTNVAGPHSWHGPSGLPIVAGTSETIRTSLTINGNGSTIQRSYAAGTPEFRIFNALYANLVLNNVIIKNGRGQGTRCGGGALYLNVSDTIIRNSTISDNWGVDGGGICNNNTSTLTIESSTISYNRAIATGRYHCGSR